MGTRGPDRAARLGGRRPAAPQACALHREHGVQDAALVQNPAIAIG